MKELPKKIIAFLTAFVFAFTGAFMFNGLGNMVYADTGSPAESSEGQETSYDKGGGVLEDFGFDTSKIPETYDADSTDNPYGSDVTTMCEMSEMVKIETSVPYEEDDQGHRTPQPFVSATTDLYGHNAKLDGEYATLKNSAQGEQDINGPGAYAFVAATDVDVKGSGRDSGAAMLYTNYKHYKKGDTEPDHNIYMKIFDPKTGNIESEPIQISSFIQNRLVWDYQIQSQLQITAGDFDNDTVDEIAVYVPAATDGAAARVAIYDLTNGTDCSDPFNKNSWQNAWNYVLPKNNAQIVEYDPYDGGTQDRFFMSNFYNNIDLAAGDADNDGSCDLVISYGASDVGRDSKEKKSIQLSLPSTTVVLYGSNGSAIHGGQMLRDSQTLDYGDDALIRVSTAFGDLDGDGNEEMIIGGQRQSEQSDNTSRALGKYTYDADSKSMVLEKLDNISIIDGDWSEDEDHNKTWASGNGWDAYYYSIPAMKTNIAVGDIMGKSSKSKIYMDSVLYSYDNGFTLVDELEDKSPNDPQDPSGKKKGSAIFTDLHGLYDMADKQVEYFEYGADVGNYTMSEGDYVTVHRVTQPRGGEIGEDMNILSDAGMIVAVDDDDNGLELTAQHNISAYSRSTEGAPITLFAADTDMDSAVLKYTGKHDLEYQDPKVIAVLASAPYYKDVADYDNGHMLDFCETTYGESTGNGREFGSNLEFTIGVYTNHAFDLGVKTLGLVNFVGFDVGSALGYKYTKEAGDSVTNTFEVTYGTAAGENQVVLMSTPVEKYEYIETTAAVDDAGNVTTVSDTREETHTHQPATVTMSVEDYMEVRKHSTSDLPDVTQYITSVPGHPETYPSGKADIPKAVKDKWKKYGKNANKDELDAKPNEDPKHDDVIKKDEYVEYKPDTWEGVGYGAGFISQSISRETDSYHRDASGVYWTFHIGLDWTDIVGEGAAAWYKGGAGVELGTNEVWGTKYSFPKGASYSGTVVNMPREAQSYGYYFSWSLMKYMVYDSKSCSFPVISYFVTDTDTAPPKLPDNISQDFDQTTDSQVGLTWNYSGDAGTMFDIYRYKDFPQGGGNELVGTVKGSDYQIVKDDDGNTLTDSNGKTIREYSFVEDGLSADTKYQYRMKVRSSTTPKESIFSPIIEGRTDVSQKPELSLSSDTLKLYPDGTSTLSVSVANPEEYETGKDYQWQKYDTKTHKWLDEEGETKATLTFAANSSKRVGKYRCRVNLVRKRESAPQYISAFTGACDVSFSKRDVVFGPIRVFDGEGRGPINTGVEVKVSNASSTGTAKPEGKVYFKISGPNGDMTLYTYINPTTGIAQINSIEDLISTVSQQAFVDGGYVITVSYEGNKVFYGCEGTEEYHYLRNIDECTWLSAQSGYRFGENIMATAHLFDFKKQADGSVTRTDITDQVTRMKIFAVDQSGQKTGEALGDFDLAETAGAAKLPLNAKLKSKAWIEVYTGEETEAAGHQVVYTAPMEVSMSVSGKISGAGSLLKPYSFEGEDVTLTGDGSLTEKNIIGTEGGEAKSLADLLKFRYYEASGEKLFDSTDLEQHPEYAQQFIPALYRVAVMAKNKDAQNLLEIFYDIQGLNEAEFLVVGSYYEVTAAPSDENAGSVRMISPILEENVQKLGFSGGSKITLKAEPARGFRVKEWKIEDGQGGIRYQKGNNLLVYTLRSEPTINTGGQVNITVIFEPKNNTLTYETKGAGSISVKPAFATGSAVLEGTEMQFTARADDGWHFKEWRWDNYGGNSSVASGAVSEGGINTKNYTMGDSPAAVYAIFARDTIDLDLQGDLRASYINDGSNPVEDLGKEIALENGKGAPKGSKIRVKTAPGFVPAEDAQWSVEATTPGGTVQPALEEFTVGTSEGVEFDLPDDVTACSVALQTEKGRYSIGLAGQDVSYVVKVDGEEIPADQYDEKLQRISAGARIEITAVPDRGKLFDYWTVDGEQQKSTDPSLVFNISDSMTISAQVKDDTDHTITAKATGGGTAVCTITGHNGEKVVESIEEEQKQITVYEGESLSICQNPEDPSHIMTEVLMGGKRQDMTDGVFTLESITDDAEIVCGFRPSTYNVISFETDVEGPEPNILDSEGKTLEKGETLEVGTGEDVTFTIQREHDYPCHLMLEDKIIEPTITDVTGEKTKYIFELENISRNMPFTITDRRTYLISSWEEFDSFMQRINLLADKQIKERSKGVIMDDFSMPEDAQLRQFPGEFTGILDGQGHTISDLKIGGESPSNGYSCIFGSIAEGACVKDLTLEGFSAYVVEAIGNGDTDIGNALVARINKGTISGVTLKDCSLTQKTNLDFGEYRSELAGIAAYNMGTIEACQVIDMKLRAERDFPGYGGVGCGIALQNHINQGGLPKYQGTITGCYVEGLQLANTSDGSYYDAGAAFICDDLEELGAGPFVANYYRGPSGAAMQERQGKNAHSLTADPEDWEKAEEEMNKPAFAAKLAYFMNKEAKAKLWGVEETGADQPEGDRITPQIIPLGCSDTCQAPVKADFKAGGKEVALYLYPAEYMLPGEESFGTDTPKYWRCGEEAYSPGFGPVLINEDMTFTGENSLKDYVATLSSEEGGTVCFTELKDALNEAASTTMEEPVLTIIGKCAMEDNAFTIASDLTMVLADGAELTMKKQSSIKNKGTFISGEGSTLHKYGSMNNAGLIQVNGTFYNYGSKLTNTGDGTVENRENIICNPHRQGDWKPAEEPNPDGTWTKTSECEVCGNTIHKDVEPDPPVKEIEAIQIVRSPDTGEYVPGEAFTTEGMVVAAIMKDGGRALIDNYTMTVDEDEGSRPIADGDILNELGDMQISVHYEGFASEFMIKVASGITELKIADGDKQVAKGEKLQLQAIWSPEEAKANVEWTSDDESIATVDKNGLVKGVSKGQVRITAATEGLTATCIVKVLEATVSLDLDAQDVLVPLGGSELVAARVSPAVEGEVNWTLPDTSVAGFCVTDEETGEVTVTDTLVTKLSPGSKGVSSAYAPISGTGEGETVITASVTDERGLVIHKECRVEVLPADATLKLKYDGAYVSGATVKADLWMESLQFEAESSAAEDTLQWLTVDDDADPVISIDEGGKVTMNRTGTAAVRVVSAKTGLSDVCVLAVGDEPQPITGLAIVDGDRSVEKDGTLQLEVELTPAGAKTPVTWTSSDEAVASVDENGLVKGLSPGQTLITASAGGFSDACVIKVPERAVTLELDQKEMTVAKDGSGLLTARVSPATSEGEITWTVSDGAVAGFYETDPETGESRIVDTLKTPLVPNAPAAETTVLVTVAGVAEGEAEITASIMDSQGDQMTQKCQVEVEAPPTTLTLMYDGAPVSGSTLTLDQALGSVQFEAVSSDPEDVLRWATVDDEADPVLSIDQTGKVGLLRSGTAVVSVISEKSGVSDVCIVRVIKKAESITISSAGVRTAMGTVKVLTAELTPADADGGIVWTSSNENVAKVTDGVVTALAEGTAVITAKSGSNENIFAECTVTVLDPNIVMTLSQEEFYCNGKEQYPMVTVTSGKSVLAENTELSNDYVLLVYDGGRMLPGEYNVTATGQDEGMGTAEATYKIVVKPTAIKKIKMGKKAISVKWKKQDKKYVTGYQVRYSTKPSMKKSKYKTIKKYKKTSLKIKKFKKNRAYFVQVRTYKTINGKRFYSAWSDVRMAGPKIKMTLSKKSFYYNGEEQYPGVTVRSGKTVLLKNATESNQFVTISYKGNKTLPGTYTVKAKASEKNMGTAKAKYRIKVKPTALTSVKAGKKSFTAKWKKKGEKYITGYRLRFSLDPKMKNSRYKTVFDRQVTELTVPGLKAKNTYYVQVRTFKTIDGTKYWSKWSKVKEVRTK